MRRAAILMLATGLAVSSTSCWVHRKSDGLVCNNTGDCKGGGTCQDGYCVGGASGCPGPCTSCDLDDMTCRIECDGSQPCGSLQCPAGYECTFRCDSSGACGDIDCAAARSCDIACTGESACHNIHCGAGECSISCVGRAACPSIDCVASCACDVSCSGNAACPSMACPMLFGSPCTHNGVPDARCDSTELDCDRCPL